MCSSRPLRASSSRSCAVLAMPIYRPRAQFLKSWEHTFGDRGSPCSRTVPSSDRAPRTLSRVGCRCRDGVLASARYRSIQARCPARPPTHPLRAARRTRSRAASRGRGPLSPDRSHARTPARGRRSAGASCKRCSAEAPRRVVGTQPVVYMNCGTMRWKGVPAGMEPGVAMSPGSGPPGQGCRGRGTTPRGTPPRRPR